MAFHGLALNVNLSLAPFSWINPCGLTGIRMTSLSIEYGAEICMEQASRHILRHLGDIFLRDLHEVEISEIWPVEVV